MFSIVITEKGGAQQQLELDEAEIDVGRLEDNDICLPKNNVSKHHARLIFKDSRYVVVDQKSTNGTYVNGRRITGPTVVRRGDKIYIGDFILTLGAASGTPKGVAAKEFSPLPLPAEGPQIPPTQLSGGMRNELKRTAPVRRALIAAAERSAAQQQAPAGLQPPPLPRTGPPPPLPRTAPSPAVANAPTAPQPQFATTPPPAATRSGSGRPAPADLSDRTMPHDIMSPLPTRSSAPPGAGETLAPPADHAQPVPGLLDDLDMEGVDSAQAAALSGLTSPAALPPSVRLQSVLSTLLDRLATHMTIEREEESTFTSEQLATLERLLDQLADEGALAAEVERRILREAAISEVAGLGPLDKLLANRSVREIVIDGPTRVLADLGGGLTPVASFFSDDGAVLVTARRLLRRAGLRFDESQKMYEGQLPGGGSVQLLMKPLSPKGTLIAVRCPVRAQSTPESFVTDGLLTSDMLALLRANVVARKNVLVVGPRGGGVSQLLALLSGFAPEHERIVAIEHSPGASMLNPQVLPLSRRALPEHSLSDLLRRAAGLRYDRLVLDDLGPEETWTALFAAAGSNGVLMGMHAPTPNVALSLFEHGAHSAMRQPVAAPGPLMAAALQLLVHVGPDASGARRVQSVSELRLTPASTLELRTLFRHDGKAFVASFHGH